MRNSTSSWVDVYPDMLYSFVMFMLGGTNETGVTDIRKCRQILEWRCKSKRQHKSTKDTRTYMKLFADFVTKKYRVHTSLLGCILDFQTMFVRAN